MIENNYYKSEFVSRKLAAKKHRELIGGRWDEIGMLQFKYMIAKGLLPTDKLADIGCGSLRGGVHFIKYLNPHNYYGFDLNRSIIDAGLRHEIEPLGLTHKVAESHMFAAEGFAFPAHWQNINHAIALSLFTHLTLNTIMQCLSHLHTILAPSARVHATFFLVDASNQWTPAQQADGIITHPVKDPYHYTYEDMLYAAEKCGFSLKKIEAFNHPRNQRMAVFEKR